MYIFSRHTEHFPIDLIHLIGRLFYHIIRRQLDYIAIVVRSITIDDHKAACTLVSHQWMMPCAAIVAYALIALRKECAYRMLVRRIILTVHRRCDNDNKRRIRRRYKCLSTVRMSFEHCNSHRHVERVGATH